MIRLSPVFRMLLALGAASAAQAAPDSTNAWGYGYDSLQIDLARWRQDPRVRIDSIGASVQNRALWRVTIGDSSGTRPRIFVHARTHPAEVQAFYVAREMIGFLLDTAAGAAEARNDFTFHFIPMYNPDGVALGRGRLNANGVDLESNWNSPSPQPEVLALRAHFQSLPTGPGAVRAALNMHSDQFNCSRFFFFHEAAGTSQAYAAAEREYITGVRSHFIAGIEPWNYITSWGDGFKPQYPESWWWQNRRESVMALTYEDTNCPGAGDFYQTGRALVLGTTDYLRAYPTSLAARAPRAGLPAGVESIRRGPVFLFRTGGRIEYRDAQGRVLKIQP